MPTIMKIGTQLENAPSAAHLAIPLPPVLRCGEKECLFLSAALDAHKDSAPALAIKLLMHTGAQK